MKLILDLKPISKDYYYALVNLQSRKPHDNQILQVTAELAVTKTQNLYFMVTQQCQQTQCQSHSTNPTSNNFQNQSLTSVICLPQLPL